MRGRITTIKRAFQLLALGLCWLWGSAVAGNNEWTSMADQPSVAVNAVHIHPQVSEVLYAGAVDGFHRSTDDGRTWQNLGAELQGRNILSLGVDPQDGDRLYAGTSIGLFGSTDGGITWNRLEGAGTGVLAVTVDGNADKPPRAERYEIKSVTKLKDDVWIFTARAKWGGADVTLPFPVRVLWAGDTPMISITDLSFPGLKGKFSTRLIFHGDRYAGTWQHNAVGGHMYGKIEKPAKKDAAK